MLFFKNILFAVKANKCMHSLSNIARVTALCRNMSSNLKKMDPLIAVCQMTSSNSKEQNWLSCKRMIEHSKQRGAQMVFLPECFDYIGESRQESIEMVESLDGPLVTGYRELAKTLGIWLSLGGMHRKGPIDSSRIYNTHLVVNNDGEICYNYDKTHLFDVDIAGKVRLKETDFTIPGETLGRPVDSPIGSIGIMTCYDVRFPEISMALRHQGAQVLTYPSAFTQTTGLAHWEVLLRSRAIENQCYVIAAAQTGKHNAKRVSYGHAMVVDPWGAVIAQCHEGEGLCFAEIDLKYLEKVRQEIPVQSHRRYDLYRSHHHQSVGNIDDPDSYQFGDHSIPSSCLFYKSALTIGFVNRKPVLPGHVLVVPIRPAKRYSDLTDAEISDMFLATQVISDVIQRQYGATSCTIAIQDGKEAGQTVMHTHVHILPRRKGDFKDNDDVYDKLEKHDKHDDNPEEQSKWRTVEDMAIEAAKLRQLFIH